MKKAYINPEMEIVEIEGQVLLAGSLIINTEAEAVETGDVLAPELGDELLDLDIE